MPCFLLAGLTQFVCEESLPDSNAIVSPFAGITRRAGSIPAAVAAVRRSFLLTVQWSRASRWMATMVDSGEPRAVSIVC